MDTLTSDLTPYRNKRGCLIWLSVLGLGFALFVVGFYQFENHRGRKALAAAMEAYTKEGECLDFQVILPPAVPAEQNFCATPALDGINDPRVLEQKWPYVLSSTFFSGDPYLYSPLSEWGEFFRKRQPAAANGKILTDGEAIRQAFLPAKPFFDELFAASSRPLAQFTPTSRQLDRVVTRLT